MGHRAADMWPLRPGWASLERMSRQAKAGAEASPEGALTGDSGETAGETADERTFDLASFVDTMAEEEDGDGQAAEPWEALIDRIQFKGEAPDVNFRAPSEVPSAYESSSGFEELDASELGAALAEAGAELWDVRSPEEFALGHVPGSRNVPLDVIGAAATGRQAASDDAESLYVICASGARSAQAQVRLTKVYGLQGVRNVRGGLAAWEGQGGELRRDINLE